MTPGQVSGPEAHRVREVSVEVTRTARVAVVGPESPTPSTWFVLHGYRQLARRFLRRFVGLAGEARRVVAPEGLSRFYLAPGDREHGGADPVGASWMTREDRSSEIRDYVRYLDEVARALPEVSLPGRPPHRTLLGFSQGAHTAARWAVMGDERVDRLVLWGTALPDDLPVEALGRLPELEVVVVRGDTDRLRSPAAEKREEAWLEAVGVHWRVVEHPGAHEIDAEVLEELAREELRIRRPG
jgi:predicted esterase